MRTLFLQAPSFDGFDGGAGSRYQARREIRSFWYPTWLAQPAALVAGQQAHRRAAARIKLAEVTRRRADYDLACSTPRRRPLPPTSTTIKALKAANPSAEDRLIGAKVAVEPQDSLQRRAGDRFRRPQRVRLHHQGGRRRAATGATSPACPTATPAGVIVHNDERAILENMDALPFVTPGLQARAQDRELFHRLPEAPYLSIYTGRGCKSRCTFCLWPQTIGGHRYRTRSVGHVVEEIAWAHEGISRR